jgi:hypothetical protein
MNSLTVQLNSRIHEVENSQQGQLQPSTQTAAHQGNNIIKSKNDLKVEEIT